MASNDEGSSTRQGPLESVSRKRWKLQTREDITDMASLVKACNEEEDPDKKGLMIGWLKQAVCWVSTQTDVALEPHIVASYANLASVKCKGPEENELLRQYFSTLMSRLEREEYCTVDVIAALEHTLNAVDQKFLKENATMLIGLPRRLLAHLDPTKKPFTKLMYAEHVVSLLAMHQTLVALTTVAPEQLTKQLISDFANTMNEIEASAEYYPYVYFARLLNHSMLLMQKNRTFFPWIVAGRRLFYATCGSLCMLQSVKTLVQIEIDFETIERGVKYFQRAWNLPGQNTWTPELQGLMEATEMSLRKEDMEHFKREMETVIKKRYIFRPKYQKMLRFSVISHLCNLVVNSKSEAFRREATAEMLNIVRSNLGGLSWFKDEDVLEAMFDALYGIHLEFGRDGDIVDAIQQLTSLATDRILDKGITSWGRGVETIDDGLEASPIRKVVTRDDLFEETRKKMGFLPTSKQCRDVEELKRYYTSLEFTTVTSFFDEWNVKHVEDLEYHMMIYKDVSNKREDDGNDPERRENHYVQLSQAKRREFERINLEDVLKLDAFDERCPSSKDRKYLLLGNAGTGKTSITKSFAHGWATGCMGRLFERVYLLPVRNLTVGRYGGGRLTKKTFLDAIVNECFGQGQSEDEREGLRRQIDDALDKAPTLLILDGLDEGDKVGTAMVNMALQMDCHVLLTSRSYNLRGIRGQVGNEMECLGLDDDQLIRFIEGELGDAAGDMIATLQPTTSLWEVAHVPVTASILCCLWKGHQEAFVVKRARDKSRLRLYEDMTDFLWDRFLEKLESSANVPNREDVFDALERIAFFARENGEILISRSIVCRHAPDQRAGGVFRQSGFLMLRLEGTIYQFVHLSFHEFFASQHLAKKLFADDPNERKVAEDFIAKNKYMDVHWDTLIFMTQTAVDRHGDQAIDRILDFVDQEPRDVVGPWHLLLKLHLIEAYLSINGPVERGFCPVSVEEVLQLAAESSRDLREAVSVHGLIVGDAEYLPNVMESFPGLLFDIFGRAKNMALTLDDDEDDDNNPIYSMARLSRVSQASMQRYKDVLLDRSFVKRVQYDGLFTHVSESFGPSSAVPDCIVHVLKEWCDSDDVGIRRGALTSGSRCIKKRPRNAEDLWKFLIALSSDKSPDVRSRFFAVVADICSSGTDLAKAAWDQMNQPFSKDGGDLSVLDKGCLDVNKRVRISASKLKIEFGILQLSPSITQETLFLAMEDPEEAVRKYVVRCIPRIVEIGGGYSETAQKMTMKGLEDSAKHVRQETVRSIGEMHLTSIEGTSTAELLATKCIGDDRYVRPASMEAIAEFITNDPESWDVPMNVLERCCYDNDSSIYHRALRRLSDAVRRIPALTTSVLRILKSRWKDGISDVRIAVVKRLLSLSVDDDLREELSDVLGTVDGPSDPDLKGKLQDLQRQVMMFGKEAGVDDFKWLLQRFLYGRHTDSVLESKIAQMEEVIPGANEMITSAVVNFDCNIVDSDDDSDDSDFSGDSEEESDSSGDSDDAGDSDYSDDSDNSRYSDDSGDSDDSDESDDFDDHLENAERLLNLVLQRAHQRNISPVYASELIGTINWLLRPKSKWSIDKDELLMLPVNWIFEYLLSNEVDGLHQRLKNRIDEVVVTVQSTDDYESVLAILDGAEVTLYRKSRKEIEYLLSFLKSLHPSLHASPNQS